MRNAILVIFLILFGGAAFVAYNAFFIVTQTQTALVLRFGEPQKVIHDPGLNFKWPFIENVEYFEKRILDFDLSSREAIEAIAKDKKRLVVDSFARYRISDALRFFQSVRNEAGARSRLKNSMESSVRDILGAATFIDIVKERRDELMKAITQSVDSKVERFGMDIIDVRLKRVDLPEANSEAIYRRMNTERQREAAEIRAQGNEQAKRIKAEADRQVTVTIAEANRDSERLRGEGDAERNRIYADAFSKDPDFFGFYRSMQAYEEGLKSEDTRLVISPNSEFFQYFNAPSGNPPPARPASPGSSEGPARTSQAGR